MRNSLASAVLIALLPLSACKTVSSAADGVKSAGSAVASGVSSVPSLVNVNFTPTSGKKARLVQVSSEAGCDKGDWYYDSVTNPTRIFLCKSTCDAVVADPMAGLKILLGCATVSDVPK